MQGIVLNAAILVAAQSRPVFYVSSSNSAASDSNAGTSPSQPWRTLQRCVEAAPLLRAGGALLLLAGDEWSVSEPLRFDGLGNQSYIDLDRVQLGVYGTAPQRPLIRAVSSSQPGPLLWLHDAARVDLQGWEIAGGEVNVEFSFGAVRDLRAHWALNLTVTDCVLRAARSRSWLNGTRGGAVVLSAAHANVTAAGLVLAHNAVVDCDAFYHTGDMPPFASAWTIVHTVGLVVEGNFITQSTFNTLSLMWMADTRVTANVFLRNGPLPGGPADTRGTTDIILGAVDSSVVVNGNEVRIYAEQALCMENTMSIRAGRISHRRSWGSRRLRTRLRGCVAKCHRL
jgi:hypothetical protein